jgi:hypothetical protein
MRCGGDDIVLLVTNHADAIGLQALGLQQMGNHLCLVLKPAAEFRAVDAGQQRRETNVIDNWRAKLWQSTRRVPRARAAG